MRILIVYRDFLKKGGLPIDTRKFVSNIPSNVKITIACNDNNGLRNNQNYDFINLDSAKDILMNKIKIKFDFGVFIGFSSIYNVLLAMKLKIPYVILPFSQINHFLDYDNPFYEKILPDVRSLETRKISYPKLSRVKNGNLDVFSIARKIKRTLFRKTLGYNYLKGASAIGVLSKYEKDEINSFYKKSSFNYFYYRFGVDSKDMKIGSDKYKDESSLIKLVIWSRVDFYYKGIDRILQAIKYLSENNYNINFKLFIVGPDYNNGYKKTDDFINENNIGKYVQLLKTGHYTPGTIGLLAQSDLSICMSRWDGPPRVLRESIKLGIPVLCSNESNFDFYIENLDCGYLVKNQNELIDILKNINRDDILIKKKNAQKYKNYFSWEKSSGDFISELIKIHEKHTG